MAPMQFGVDPVAAPAEKREPLPGEFQEYPKWVFPNGDASKGVKVHDAEQEAQALADEPTGTEAPDEPPRRKPGRPRKSE